MNTKKILAGMALLLLLAQGARADVPQLQNLTGTQVDAVFDNFGAALVFKPVEPAGAYGDIFGVAVGVIGGVASASKINNVISGSNVSVVPNADIFLGAQAPFGLAIEIGFVPQRDFSDFSVRRFGFNAKWTLTKVVLTDFPFDIAARMMFGSSELSYRYTISGISDTATYDTNQWGFNLSIGKSLFIVDPYIGLGFVNQSSTLSNGGNIPLFNTTVSTARSYSKDKTSVWFYAGAEVKLMLLTLGVQYDNVFGTHTGSGKIGLKF